MAFLGDGDFLVLEKASGKVKHVIKGSVVSTPLDLPVNSASERGLLGIALQPDFANTHGVYLYWTQSSTGADSANLAEVPLLGNRVDRYVWNPATEMLVFDKNIIMLHAFQADANQPMRGNHDGGKILFGPDGKLYFQIGDQGRRGQMQNLVNGPFGAGKPDDDFGGPAPDNAHLTGVILRLNPDGTTPADNPFAQVTWQDMNQIEKNAGVTTTPDQLNEVAANVRKIFSYGRRNGFGLAFDPATGFLWESENGDDAFDEMNLITAGSNGGWIQIIGPSSRVADFKGIEASFTPLQGNLPVAGNLPFSAIDPTTFIPALQQVRWPPTLIANSPGEARNRLFVLPGSHYEEPEFAWKWAVAPAAIGFAGNSLGAQHTGNLFVGASRTFLEEGYLFEFKFDQSRKHFAFDDAKLKDGVDDNDYKFDEGESTSLIAGKNFGVVTNIVTGPDGSLYVTSLSNGKIYVIGGASTVPGATNPSIHPTIAHRVLGTVEEYDPEANTWRARANMPTPRNHTAAGVVNGKIYVIGGRIGAAFVGASTNLAAVEAYDPATDTWSGPLAKMPTARSGLDVGVYNGRIIVAGGEFQNAVEQTAYRVVEAYDPMANSWAVLPPMALARHGVAGGVIGNRFYAISGDVQSSGTGIAVSTAAVAAFEFTQ